MAAKFGATNGSRMGGIGSDPNYNPNHNAGSTPVDFSSASTAVLSGLGSAFGALGNVASSVTAAVQDQRQMTDMASGMAQTAGSFWGSLSAGASTLVASVTAPDNDGLEDLQRQFQNHRTSADPSKYSGFGNTNSGFVPPTATSTTTSPPDFFSPTVTLVEAQPGPGEDPNGMERLSGETDEQYVLRQTRLRDEAKARMAAKFGSGGMSGVGSGGYTPSSENVSQQPKAPSSGNVKVASGNDFFANFGA